MLLPIEAAQQHRMSDSEIQDLFSALQIDTEESRKTVLFDAVTQIAWPDVTPEEEEGCEPSIVSTGATVAL